MLQRMVGSAVCLPTLAESRLLARSFRAFASFLQCYEMFRLKCCYIKFHVNWLVVLIESSKTDQLKARLHSMRFKAHWAWCTLTAGQCMLNAHQPASTLAVVMRIELKSECISPTFVIGSGTLTRAFVSSVVQPAAISSAKNQKKVWQQLRPHKKKQRTQSHV